MNFQLSAGARDRREGLGLGGLLQKEILERGRGQGQRHGGAGVPKVLPALISIRTHNTDKTDKADTTGNTGKNGHGVI